MFAFAASESGSSFACRLDNGSFSSCASPKTYTDLSDGPHAFAVRATDAAGNTGPDVAYGWTIETRSPTAAVTLAPVDSEQHPVGDVRLLCRRAGDLRVQPRSGGFQPCSSPALYQGLGDGPHTFAVRPRDAVGNVGAPASYSWGSTRRRRRRRSRRRRSPGRRPRRRLRSRPAKAGRSNAGSTAHRLPLCASPKSYSPLRPGDHQFEVRAVDAAGNADPTPALHGVEGRRGGRQGDVESSPLADCRIARHETAAPRLAASRSREVLQRPDLPPGR